ncbi:GNAT family N-acetyltransferase [Soonwooa sp.]|uniref:GNAT family N-acetyltransferase n=1 Tax=Soonwooa sp. TaxID=1938592 RepID=UPI00261D4CEB|nr:GNAT family N-acetyltransferase [Soonwooa sp.]
MTTIIAYEPLYFNDLMAYDLDEEQAEFSRIPAQVLTDPKMMTNQHFHHCILFDGKVVGFFTLDFSDERLTYSSNKDAVLLRSLSINPAFQGKGIAKSVMLQLPDWVKTHFPRANEIVFGVNIRNKNAYELYLKTGYSDSGNIYEGKKGPQNLMFKTLL